LDKIKDSDITDVNFLQKVNWGDWV
jgi:hypothetical protein